MDTQLGLPKIVVDLISGENMNFGDNLTWKVVSNKGYTELILTWDKGANYNPQDQLHMFKHHDHKNNRYGYRKKTPSEIRRDQKRKQEYLQSKRKTVSSHESEPSNMIRNDISTDSVPSMCEYIGTVSHKPSVSQKPASKCNMKTRSMAKRDRYDQVENARSPDVPSLSNAAQYMSPETVSETPSPGYDQSISPGTVLSLSDAASDSVKTPNSDVNSVHESFEYVTNCNASNSATISCVEPSHNDLLQQDFVDFESKMDTVFAKYLKDFKKACT